MIRLRVVPRDGAELHISAEPGESLLFGRSEGLRGVIGLGGSASVSRAAFSVAADPLGLIAVTSRQRFGTLEVKRPDGLVAAMLRSSESGVFHAPLALVLHTVDGMAATVFVTSDVAASGVPALTERDMIATRSGWSTTTIMHPPPGLDWMVAASLAAMLLRQGRRGDPGYGLPRGILLRASGIWLGAAKSEGWLASKFKQAGTSLGVRFEANPAHQLGEYVLQAGLLSDAALESLHAEYLRRRS